MVRDVAISIASRGVMVAAGVVTSILTARALGVAGRGEYFYVMTLANSAVQFANLGMASSNTYSLAKDHTLLPRLAANSLWLSLVAGGLAALCILLFKSDRSNPYWVSSPILVLVPMVPSLLYGLLASNLLIGLSRIRQYNVFVLASAAIQLAAIAWAARTGLGVRAFLMVSAFSALVAALGLGLMLARLHTPTWKFDLRLLRSNMGYAGRAYVAAFLAYGVSRAGVFLLDHFVGKAEIGIYSVAVQFADTLIIVPATVGMVLFPDLLRGPAEYRFARTVHASGRVALMMGALCLTTAFAVRWIVPALFGAAFDRAVHVLWWMLPGVFALSVATIVSQYLATHGIPAANVWAWLGGLVVLVGVGSCLVPRWGASGAAASLSVTYVLLAVTLVVIALRHSAGEPRMSVPQLST